MRNSLVRKFCGEKKGMDDKIDERILHWFGNIENMDGIRVTKMVHKDKCLGNDPVGYL